MNMDKQVQDFEVENMLENWQKTPLQPTTWLAAKDRIWSKISAKTLNLDTDSQFSNLQSKSPMSSENPQSDLSTIQTTSSNKLKNPKPWFLQPLNLSLISLAMILIIGGGAGLVYLNQSNQKLNEQLALRKEMKNSKTALNPISKTDLSLDEIRGLATIKLSNYTNGASLDEIQSSSSKNVATQPNTTGGLGGAGAPVANPTSIKKEVQTPTSEALVKEKGIVDKVVYYTENLNTETNDGIAFPFLKNVPGFDINKPVKTQSWTSANYSKYITSQDGKIFSYNIYTPEYSVDFKGGKYAVKEIFDQKLFLSGFSQDVPNTELSSLKSILSDASLKDSGRQDIDGKNYKVLETDTAKMATDPNSNDNNITTTKYYLDTAKLSVFRVEYYTNKILVSSSTQTNYQEYKDPNLSELFGVSDLGQTEIKTVKRPVYQDSINDLSDISKKMALYVPANVTEKELKMSFSAYNTSYYDSSEIDQLTNTKDFDPSLDDTYLKTSLNPAVAEYYLNNFFSSAYRKPVISEEGLKIKLQRNQTIKLDGKDTAAVYKEVYSEGQEIFYQLEFESPDGLWYKISEYPSNLPVGQAPVLAQSKNIKLTKLSSDLVDKITNFQKDRSASFADIDSESKLEDISKNIRILPGDLSKDYKISLYMVSKSRKVGSASKCEKYLDSGYSLIGCLIEQYNGFTLNFYEKYDSNIAFSSTVGANSIGPKDLNFSVLDTKFENLDLAKYAKLITENTPLSTQNTSSSISGDEKIKEFNYNDGYTNMTIYFSAYKDKTIVISSSSLVRAQLLDILKKSDFDRDLNVLLAQIKESKMPISDPKPIFDLNK